MENFEKYENDISNFSRRYKIPGMEWGDIAQELRIELWKKLPKYNSELSSERTFVIMLIKRKIISLARKANAQKRIPDNHHIGLEGIDLPDTREI